MTAFDASSVDFVTCVGTTTAVTMSLTVMAFKFLPMGDVKPLLQFIQKIYKELCDIS